MLERRCKKGPDWLSNREQCKTEPCSLVRGEHGYAFESKQNRLEQHDFKDLVADTQDDDEIFAHVGRINDDRLLLAKEERMLKS
jgi:hypothetical protein